MSELGSKESWLKSNANVFGFALFGFVIRVESPCISMILVAFLAFSRLLNGRTRTATFTEDMAVGLVVFGG